MPFGRPLSRVCYAPTALTEAVLMPVGISPFIRAYYVPTVRLLYASVIYASIMRVLCAPITRRLPDTVEMLWRCCAAQGLALAPGPHRTAAVEAPAQLLMYGFVRHRTAAVEAPPRTARRTLRRGHETAGHIRLVTALKVTRQRRNRRWRAHTCSAVRQPSRTSGLATAGLNLSVG